RPTHRSPRARGRHHPEPQPVEEPPAMARDAATGADQRDVSRTPLRPWLFAAVVAATAAGVSLGVIGSRWLQPADQDSRPSRALQRVTYDEATLPRDASWGPDGRWIVYA